jgi:hypothetical protein
MTHSEQTAAHTPGPWEADRTGFDVQTKLTQVPLFMATTRVSDEEAKANARLIAAAPDLLEALREELDAVQDDIRWADGGELERLFARRERLSAAISRAEGRTEPKAGE